MHPQLTFRDAHPADAHGLAGVDGNAIREAAWHDLLERLEGDEHARELLVVATLDGEVVGFVHAGAARERRGDYDGELYALCVRPEHRKRGIGRALVTRAAEGLVGARLYSMAVWVPIENPARRFFERLGGERFAMRNTGTDEAPSIEIGYGWRDIAWLCRLA